MRSAFSSRVYASLFANIDIVNLNLWQRFSLRPYNKQLFPERNMGSLTFVR